MTQNLAAKACVVVVLLTLAGPALPEEYTIGPWRLGMTKETVRSFDEFGPYSEVDATGGIETRNGTFEGESRTISFVFAGDALDYIQVWNYEGKDADVAKQRILELFDLFESQFGGASVENIDVSGPNGFDRGAMNVVLDRIIGTARDLANDIRKKEDLAITIMFDMKPAAQPDGSRLHSMWGYSSRFDTFYVLLFQDPVDAPERHVESNIVTEEF